MVGDLSVRRWNDCCCAFSIRHPIGIVRISCILAFKVLCISSPSQCNLSQEGKVPLAELAVYTTIWRNNDVTSAFVSDALLQLHHWLKFERRTDNSVGRSFSTFRRINARHKRNPRTNKVSWKLFGVRIVRQNEWFIQRISIYCIECPFRRKAVCRSCSWATRITFFIFFV